MAKAAAGTAQQIVVMEGKAFIRDATGKETPIAEGDVLQSGQVVFTSATGHITLMMPNGQLLEIGADRSVLLDGDLAASQPTDATEALVTNPALSADQLLAALNQGKDIATLLDAPAAGLNAGGASDEGSSFVRLLRIAEAVDPISFDFANGTGPTTFNEPTASDGQAIVATVEPTPATPAEPVTPTPDTPTPPLEVIVATPTITASLGNTSVSEGSAAVFTVTLSNPSATPTEITLNVLTGGSNTASASDVGALEYFNGSDWVPVVDGKVTVPANETSIQVRVPTIQDNVYEGTETFQLQATVNGQTATGNGSIVDDGTGVVPPDQPGTPDDDRPHILSISNAAAVEGNALVFDVKLDHSSTTPTTVTLDLQSGSGTVGVDTGAISVSFDGGVTYVAVIGSTISVPANTLDIKVQVATIDDALLEGPETVTLHATTQFEAANALVGTGTITDDVGPGLPGEPGVEDTVLVSIAGPANVIEGDKTAPYTVSLTQAAASDMTIQLSYSGTATDGSDYVKVISVTIPAGASSVTFDLQTLDDALLENGETIVVSLGAISGGGFEAVHASAANSVTTTIADDVGPGLPGIPEPEDTVLVSIDGPASVLEGAKTTPYMISLTQAAASDMTIQLSYSGTATDGSDYVKVISVTIPAGASSATFDLQTLDDSSVEGLENIQVSLGAITGGGFEAVQIDPAHASVDTTISDNDSATLGIRADLGDASVSEGSAAVFTVTLSNPSATPTEITLNLLTGGSNTASNSDVGALEYFNGSDWVPVVDGKVTVPANETSIQVRVPTIQDNVYEGTETFQLQATVNGQTATGNGSIVDDGTGIVPPDQPGTPDDDRPHILSISNAAAVEGNALVFDVKLDHSSTTPTTVTLDLQSGSGTVGVDTGAISVSFDGGVTYVAVIGNTISVPANTLDIKVQVATIDDALLEGPETVTLHATTQFEAANALAGTGTITDDVGPGLPGEPGVEDTVLVSIAGPANVIEGDKTTPYTVSLTQAAASNMTIQLNYSGTASDGSDYVKVVSVTIPAGASSVTFDLQTLDDALLENGETIVVSLGAISGGGFEAVHASAANSVTTTIADDVGPGLPGIAGPEDTVLVSIDGPASVLEGAKTTPYTISLTQAAASDMTIQLSYSGTATDGSDYVKVISVTIPAGASSATFDLQTLDDSSVEGLENIQVSLGAITGGGFEAVAIDPAHASVSTNIVDTDALPETQNVTASGLEDAASIAINLIGTDSDGHVASFRLSNLPSDGTLYLDAAMTQAVSANTDLAASGNQLTLYFKPNANWNGSTSFEYAAKDNEGLIDATPATATISVTAVNDAPTAAGGIAHGSEDTPLVSGTVGLNWASFHVADIDSPDSSLSIKITSLPADGHLQYFSGGSWLDVAVNQLISKAEIDGGHLRFVPDANESGSDGYGGAGVGNEQADYAQFTYQATDGSATSATATMTIDIEPVADTPSLSLEEHEHDAPPQTGNDGGLVGLDLGLGIGGGLLGLGVLANVGVPSAGDHCNWFTSHSTNLLDLNLNANLLDNVHDHGQLIDASLGAELGGVQLLNLFTNIEVKAHEVVTISLDLEALNSLGAGVDLYWEGCKVATLDVAVDGLCSFVYQLIASKDGTSCLEFRPCDGVSNPCQIDNLCVSKSPDNVGCEDHWITLSKINANLNDNDGSETLGLTMSQIPVGATLSDGVHTFIATQNATSVDLAGWNLDALKILPPADFNGQFNLTVTATATETANGDQASTSGDICVTVLPEPDPAAPTASGGEVIGREDWPMVSGTACFNWRDFNVADADSPDHCLGIKITSLPADGQLKYFSGLTWCDVALNQVISKEAIDHGGLIFIPDRDESGIDAYGGTGVGDQQADYAKFTYQATDGVQTSANATMTIDIEPVADTPWLSLSNHHLIDVTDFQNVSLLGGVSVEANVNSLLSTNGHLSWFTSNSSGLIDLGAEAHFLGNGNLLNNVVELVQDTGKALNLFTNVEVKANEVFTLSVDFAASLTAVGALVDVFWEGHKVATLDSATIALQTFTLNLVASADGLACLEFKAVGTAACVLDNLCFIKAPDNIGLEDHWINLSKINTHLLDGDGSETLRLTVGNIPVGAQLSDGVHTFTATAGMSTLDATSWNLDTLKILPPADFNGVFNLSVTATATETANGDQASNCADICVKVLAVNDAALISGVNVGNVQEDTNFVNGHITACGQLTISDADGNGQACFIPQLNTIGQYGFLSLGTDGQWVYTLANFAPNVQHLDTSDHKVDTFLVMSADGSVQTITINVAGLDEPNHAPLADSHAIGAAEGAITPLFIAPPVDVDGDHLTIKISGLPTAGQVLLHDGTPVTDGMVLTYHELSSLLFMALPGSVSSTTPAGSLSYSVDDGHGHVVNAAIDITVLNNPLADLVMGGGGVDNFTLIPWLDTTLKLNGQLAAFFDGLGNAIQLPQLFHNTQANADLTIMAGQSNDTIELGLSTGNNIVFGGSSLPNNAPVHDLAQVSATAFMQDDVIVHSDGRLTASAALSVQSSATLFDNVNTGSGNDTIFSGGGNMVAHGGAGNDTLYGNNGSDGLRGGSGNDVLAGGKGDDILRGDSGSDVFQWSLGDQGSAGTPAYDVVMDFNNAKSHNAAGEHDKLDLSDLLQGEDSSNLDQYMHFEKSGSDTIIHISTQGQFDAANATHSDVSSKEDQVITLQGVDLTTAGATDQAIIQDLLNKGHLTTD